MKQQKKKLVVIRVSLSFGSHKVLYVKKQKVCKQHLVPELLCRCEIGLPPELIGKHVHVCSRRFIPESVFYTKSILLSLHFMPQAMFYTQSVAHIPGFMLAGTLQYNPTIL